MKSPKDTQAKISKLNKQLSILILNQLSSLIQKVTEVEKQSLPPPRKTNHVDKT